MKMAVLFSAVPFVVLAAVVAWILRSRSKRLHKAKEETIAPPPLEEDVVIPPVIEKTDTTPPVIEKSVLHPQAEEVVTPPPREEEVVTPPLPVEETSNKEGSSPINRGGGARGSREQRGDKKQKSETEFRSLKPEIVCWKEGWSWVIGIEIAEKLEITSITQNDKPLEQDNVDESCYRLKHAKGGVKVTWAGEEKEIPLLESKQNYFIFKMRKDWKGVGRLVRYSTTGHYLAVVPQKWKRDEEVSGSASINPENVQLDEYKAHFFYQEQNRNTAIGFITESSERIRVGSGSPRFQLVGKEISDASEEMGLLFGEQPPYIRTHDEQGWNDVGVIVVGKEGSGRNRWRTQFIPQTGVKEQKLPEEISIRRGGWYFVRIYDNNDDLLESMDFRLLIGLKDIYMENFDCLPGLNGYDNTTIQFLHDADCNVELMDEGIQHVIEIHRESGQTIATVPPKADCDKTRWILRDGDAEIEATVLVERIWWACGTMGVCPDSWVDKPITISRRDFTASTDKALWVRLPCLRFVGKIDVGFDRTKSRPYQVEVEQKEVAISIRDFCDTIEIEDKQRESRIMVWVQPEEAKSDEAIIVKIPAELPPPEKPKSRQRLKPKGSVLLYAIVKCRCGKRKGKGFSKKEIFGIGMAIEDMKKFRIPYDKRRKSLHSWNVENLKLLMRENNHAHIGT